MNIPSSSHPIVNRNATEMACQAPLFRITDDAFNECTDQEACRYPELLRVSSYNSLSSLSSCGSDTHTRDFDEEDGISSQRSIFKSYWEKSRRLSQIPVVEEKPLESDTTAPTVPESLNENDDDSTCCGANSYERSLSRHERVKTPSSKRGSSNRRSIFGNSSGEHPSMPSLMARPYHPTPLQRRAKSTSALVKGRLPSCLRSPSHDGDEQQRKIRSSSVSFDTEVSVFEFNPSKENYAADGWSKWFH